LFTRVEDGVLRMHQSFLTLKASSLLARTAWELIKKDPENQENLLDPRVILPFNRMIGASLDNIDEVFAGKGARSTVVNGEVISYNIEAFFMNPPQRLADFYPQDFHQKHPTLEKSIGGETVKFRNYLDGSATRWNYAAYQPYFPDITPVEKGSKYTADIPRVARILGQTWGSAAFSLPLMSFIF
jgi:hypothetical protein